MSTCHSRRGRQRTDSLKQYLRMDHLIPFEEGVTGLAKEFHQPRASPTSLLRYVNVKPICFPLPGQETEIRHLGAVRLPAVGSALA